MYSLRQQRERDSGAANQIIPADIDPGHCHVDQDRRMHLSRASVRSGNILRSSAICCALRFIENSSRHNSKLGAESPRSPPIRPLVADRLSICPWPVAWSTTCPSRYRCYPSTNLARREAGATIGVTFETILIWTTPKNFQEMTQIY